MLLRFCALGVTMSWDDGFPWERGRPARTMMASRERGRPARLRQCLAQVRPSPPLGSTGNGAIALLRPLAAAVPARPGWRLQHRTEAQRRPKGQDAVRDARAPRAITPPLRGSRRSRPPPGPKRTNKRNPRRGTKDHEGTRRKTKRKMSFFATRRRRQSSLVFDLRYARPPPCRAHHSRKNG